MRFCRKHRKDRHSIGADRTIGSPWPLSSQTVELIYEAALRNRAHLSLADHLDDFNTLEGGVCTVEGFEAKCRSRFLFDGPMGLFDDIVEVFALPNFDVCARFIVVSLNRRGVGATLVNVDLHRCAVVADSLPQEAKSCSLVSFRG